GSGGGPHLPPSPTWRSRRILAVPGGKANGRAVLPAARAPPRARRVQLGIAPEYPLLVERDPPLRLQVCCDPRPLGHPIAERDEPRGLRLVARRRVRKGVAQPLDHLERRQVDIGPLPSHQPPPRAPLVAPEEVLEPAEISWDALLHEVPGAPLRLPLLVLVVQATGDRMVAVMGLGDEVGDGELDLVRFGPEGLVPGRESE